MNKAVLFNHHISPRLEDVKFYFLQFGAPEQEAVDFFHLYEFRHWKSKKGRFITNWKGIAHRWIRSVLKTNPRFSKEGTSGKI